MKLSCLPLRHASHWTIFAILVSSHLAVATQPVTFNYQAKLTDSADKPLQGSHSLIVSLWDGGTTAAADSGTQVYSETASVLLSDGVVNYAVGTGDYSPGSALSDSVFASSNAIFLQVAVDSPSSVVLPRVRLQSVPFAIRALSAENGVPPGLLALDSSTKPPQGFSATDTTLYNSWQLRVSVPTGRRFCASASANGKVYVTGGFTTGYTDSASTVTESFDPYTNLWTTQAPMATPRAGHASCELNGLIYAIGGYTPANIPQTSVEAYDPIANSWSPRAPLILPTAVAACAAVNGKIYVIGGEYFPDTTSTVEEYNPGTNSWTLKAPMPTSRTCTGAAINGKIYVFGGGPGPNGTNEMYDPDSNTWTPKASLPSGSYNIIAVAAGDKIYVTGGTTQASPYWSNENRIYDPASDSWEQGPTLPDFLGQHSSAVLNGRIYCNGGANLATGQGTFNFTWDPGVLHVLKKD